MAKRVARKKTASVGFGDTVEKVLKAIAVDKVAKFIMGEDCGCDERKEKLNKLFPYRQLKCLTEDEYNYLNETKILSKNEFKPSDQYRLLEIYNRVFGVRQEPTSCVECFRDLVKNMKVVLNEYETKEL